MSNSRERALLLQCLEQMGKDWEEDYTAEDIRHCEGKIDVLTSVQGFIKDTASELSAEDVRIAAPTFVRVFRSVLLRDLQERASHGSVP